MIVNLDSLVTLGRAQVAFCEQLARFALESVERAQRANMDAFEWFWARRVAEAEVVAELDAPSIPNDVSAAALLEHWTRTHDTAVYLCHEFGRMADEYADDLKTAARAASDSTARDAQVRLSGAGTTRTAESALAAAA